MSPTRQDGDVSLREENALDQVDTSIARADPVPTRIASRPIELERDRDPAAQPAVEIVKLHQDAPSTGHCAPSFEGSARPPWVAASRIDTARFGTGSDTLPAPKEATSCRDESNAFAEVGPTVDDELNALERTLNPALRASPTPVLRTLCKVVVAVACGAAAYILFYDALLPDEPSTGSRRARERTSQDVVARRLESARKQLTAARAVLAAVENQSETGGLHGPAQHAAGGAASIDQAAPAVERLPFESGLALTVGERAPTQPTLGNVVVPLARGATADALAFEVSTDIAMPPPERLQPTLGNVVVPLARGATADALAFEVSTDIAMPPPERLALKERTAKPARTPKRAAGATELGPARPTNGLLTSETDVGF